MQIVADLQLHSKYSRAVSPDMVIPIMTEWGEKKGIDLMATGDWTHPLWFKELESNLEEAGEGIYKLKNSTKKTRFFLSGEISSIYTDGGKGRRVHTLFFAPSLATVRKINEELVRRGANLMSDGRPIVGLSCQQLCEAVWGIDERVLVVPAHCLLPEEMIMTETGIKAIGQTKKNDMVLTHKGRYKKVTEVLKRKYNGKIIRIRPWYFSLGLATTPEHPYWAIKTVKKCRSTGDICRPFGRHVNHCRVKHYLKYRAEWLAADKLEVGDFLIYPILSQTSKLSRFRINDAVPGLEKDGKRVRIKSSRGLWINNEIEFDADFGRLIGYYLAEGYIYGKNGIGFCFNRAEKDLVEDVKSIIGKIFGLNKFREYYRKGSGGVELSVSSEILTRLFRQWFYGNGGMKRANNKQLPSWMLNLNLNFQAELLLGWWRGDKGYTVSRELINQMKMVCLRLKILPGVGITKAKDYQKRGHYSYIANREIKANHDLYYLNRLSFIEDKFRLMKRLKDERLLRKLDRKHGWIDDNYAYLPIRKIEKTKHRGEVYNLEVETDNSYVAEFAAVHNCWTPWFSLYGSKSGFDSVEECFGKYADRIYAVETGLSSDPVMNWRIPDLDRRAIVSFSDAHSPKKLGREATVFSGDFNDEVSFNDVAGAIGERFLGKNSGRLKIAYTIEFHPEEGKYHYTGHRTCGVVQSPEETRAKGTVCHVCGRQLTVGVEHRVDELAKDRQEIKPVKKTSEAGVVGYYHPTDSTRPPYVKIVPLHEILAEVVGVVSISSPKVTELYERLIDGVGSEFAVLLKSGLEKIKAVAGERTAEAIQKVRSGEIVVQPGYDGVFGVVKIWGDKSRTDPLQSKSEQTSLF